MRIDVVADTTCPWCFIGKRRLERALASRPQRDVEIAWRPYFLNPDVPAEGADRAEYVARRLGGGERAARLFSAVAEVGAGEDIAFRFDRIARMPNTLQSHRLIHYADETGLQGAVVEALYRSYFLAGRDIGDMEVLADIAAEAGLARDDALAYLRSGADSETIVAADEKARTLGVAGVPCFIIDRRYAVSGAQLPEVFHQVFELANQEALQPAG
jgi:predicted DsbA family dithiol-disulfide isomerase